MLREAHWPCVVLSGVLAHKFVNLSAKKGLVDLAHDCFERRRFNSDMIGPRDCVRSRKRTIAQECPRQVLLNH